jgi:hypothetical protein
MAQAVKAPNTCPSTIRLIADAMVATHPLMNRIDTTIDGRVLKMVGVSDLLQRLFFRHSYYSIEWFIGEGIIVFGCSVDTSVITDTRPAAMWTCRTKHARWRAKVLRYCGARIYI